MSGALDRKLPVGHATARFHRGRTDAGLQGDNAWGQALSHAESPGPTCGGKPGLTVGWSTQQRGSR